MITIYEFIEELNMGEKVIMLSIKPRYSRLIFEGRKTVELRKRFPRFPSRFVLVYESSPLKEIAGYFEVKEVQFKTIEDLKKYSKRAVVDKTFINEYYKGKNIGVAIEIKKVFEFENKIPLTRLKKKANISPPQDFKYLRKEEIATLV